ncbi:dienelactone hydrolase family protein [Gammaproteobacteria bacterium]|nr:dienelactone hydrolase family protein [Gammaproteobacteria bacterium]
MNLRLSRLTLNLTIAFSISISANYLAAADNTALVNQFWSTPDNAQNAEIQSQLISSSSDVSTLYQLLKTGPTYRSDVPTGQQESIRIAADGTRFPFIFLVPDNYDPTHRYPVEFMLHGGVSRPEWEPGGGWWRRGFDSLEQSDRIVVIPASWVDAFWWHENQAENLPAILNTLKASYNIDEDRVTLTGVSDGGTGAYFFAFKQPTPWAAFLPYIGHPGVLRNQQSGGGYRLYFENLMSKPLYIVNGENDRLYPASSVAPFIEILAEEGVDHIWKVVPEGGHNTNWLPDEAPMIEKFKQDNPRNALPERVQWVADRTDKFNRNLWVQIDSMSQTPGLLEVNRNGNEFRVLARGVSEFTLLLNPEEVNFSQAIQVYVNSENIFDEIVVQDKQTLLHWASKDLDRSMLFTAELKLRTGE